MFTIFTIPKPFTDPHINIIQRNAIKSWLKLRPKCEIILIGNDEGVNKIAREYNITHLPDVKINEFGTPLLDSAFSLAQQTAKFNNLVYVNADIIFLSDFTGIEKNLPKENFLIIGQRYDMDIKYLIDFDDKSWGETLRNKIIKNPKLHRPEGSDYFLYKKDSLDNIPEFAVGRVGWDNWMIYNAKRLGWLTIDATKVITKIHQNHDNTHQLKKKVDKKNDPEAIKNIKLTHSDGWLYLDETDWILTADKKLKKRRFIKKARIKRYLKIKILKILQLLKIK